MISEWLLGKKAETRFCAVILGEWELLPQFPVYFAVGSPSLPHMFWRFFPRLLFCFWLFSKLLFSSSLYKCSLLFFPPFFCFVVLDICSTDGVSSSWSDSCYIYPSPEDDKPPPYSSYPSLHHFHSKISPGTRPEPPLPLYRWSGYSQTLPPAAFSSSSSSSPSPQQLDINSNPKPYFLHLPKQSSLTEMHGPETNLSSVHMKTSLTLSKPDPPGTLYSSHMSVSPPWVSCTCARDRGAGLTR